jgi:hypothetical protein
LIIINPICVKCNHFNSIDNDKLGCRAFPKGIPPEIITGEHDHTKPFKGDGGIRFEPIKVLKQTKVNSDE